RTQPSAIAHVASIERSPVAQLQQACGRLQAHVGAAPHARWLHAAPALATHAETSVPGQLARFRDRPPIRLPAPGVRLEIPFRRHGHSLPSLSRTELADDAVADLFGPGSATRAVAATRG